MKDDGTKGAATVCSNYFVDIYIPAGSIQVVMDGHQQGRKC